MKLLMKSKFFEKPFKLIKSILFLLVFLLFQFTNSALAFDVNEFSARGGENSKIRFKVLNFSLDLGPERMLKILNVNMDLCSYKLEVIKQYKLLNDDICEEAEGRMLGIPAENNDGVKTAIIIFHNNTEVTTSLLNHELNHALDFLGTDEEISVFHDYINKITNKRIYLNRINNGKSGTSNEDGGETRSYLVQFLTRRFLGETEYEKKDYIEGHDEALKKFNRLKDRDFIKYDAWGMSLKLI